MKPAAWHEPNSYGKVTTHKKWALENGWLPLYAAPVRTKDLTDDEIAAVWRKADSVKASKELFDFLLPKNLVIARAVIAADREKNNANNNS